MGANVHWERVFVDEWDNMSLRICHTILLCMVVESIVLIHG